MEKRLRNLYKHELFYLDYQLTKIPNFIRGAQAAAPPHPLRSYATLGAHFLTFCDKALLNGEKFKKPS